MRHKQALKFLVKVYLGVMTIKEYSILLRSLDMELYQLTYFSAISRISFHGRSYPSVRDTISIFS